jgi:hypothetical protein
MIGRLGNQDNQLGHGVIKSELGGVRKSAARLRPLQTANPKPTQIGMSVIPSG